MSTWLLRRGSSLSAEWHVGDLLAEDVVDADTRPLLDLLLGPLLVLLPHMHDCSCGGAVDLVAVHALEVLGDLVRHAAMLADPTGILSADSVVGRRLRGRSSVLPHAHWLTSIDNGQTAGRELAMQGCRGRRSGILRHDGRRSGILAGCLGCDDLA